MSDLRGLYQEVILDHGKAPRNFRALPDATCAAEGHNPLCGDHITLYVELDGDVIKDISFQGAGCAISTASASMMTTQLKGKTVAEADQLFAGFHEMLTGGAQDAEKLGKLAVFSGVNAFPVRVKCATLPWHTLHAALERKPEPITTE
jgi:nitrogen fixation protein NifU and related proteins